MTSKAISHRLTLARDQNWKCHYCLRRMVTKTERSETATVDHKTPLARGGGWGAHNLVACCWRCNNIKGSLTEEEFRSEWGDMSRLPERNPGNLSNASETLARRKAKEAARRETKIPLPTMDQGVEGKWASKKLPNASAANPPCGISCLGDIAPHLQRAIPWQVRLDRAWNALWKHCMDTADWRREVA